MMKLYDLDKGDFFRLAGDDNSPVIKFDHLDGMYSVCYLEKDGDFNELVHLAGFTPVLRYYEESRV